MKPKKLPSPAAEVVGFLGVGLDADGHRRLTQCGHFLLVGGAALSPFIVELPRRFPLGPGSWWRSLPVHVVAAIAFMLVKIALDLPVYWLVHGPRVLLAPLSADVRLRDPVTIFVELFKLYVAVK